MIKKVLSHAAILLLITAIGYIFNPTAAGMALAAYIGMVYKDWQTNKQLAKVLKDNKDV